MSVKSNFGSFVMDQAKEISNAWKGLGGAIASNAGSMATGVGFSLHQAGAIGDTAAQKIIDRGVKMINRGDKYNAAAFDRLTKSGMNPEDMKSLDRVKLIGGATYDAVGGGAGVARIAGSYAAAAYGGRLLGGSANPFRNSKGEFDIAGIPLI